MLRHSFFLYVKKIVMVMAMAIFVHHSQNARELPSTVDRAEAPRALARLQIP